MRLRTSTKIAWNSVFMLLAVAYLFMFYSLGNSPSSINRLGAYLIAQHQLPYDQAFMEAAEALEQGDTAIAVATLAGWQDVKKGDRVFSQKSRLLQRLSSLLREQNRVPELLDLTNTWQALDGRDITARAYYFEALRLIPESHAEGINGLALTYLHFPKNQQVAGFYANSLREAGEIVAADKIQKSKVIQQMLNWELFWDTGEGFNASEKSKINIETTLPDKGYRISFTLPATTRNFRLDLPPSSTLVLSHLAIRINGQPYLINQSTFKLVMMQHTRGMFVSTGGVDPFIVFDLKHMTLAQGAALNLEITFKIASASQQHRTRQL